MREGTCPNCGSKEIYTSDSPYSESIYVKSITPGPEIFTTSACVCAECGHLQMYVSDTSVALFGKGKTLKECLATSSNWTKV